MNKQVRKDLKEKIKVLEKLKAELDKLENAACCLAIDFRDVANEIEEIKDKEQDKYDNLPEGLQLSSMGEDLNDGIDGLDDAYGELYEIAEDFENFCDEYSDKVQEIIDNLEEL